MDEQSGGIATNIGIHFFDMLEEFLLRVLFVWKAPGSAAVPASEEKEAGKTLAFQADSQ
jgi:hypothetical protein